MKTGEIFNYNRSGEVLNAIYQSRIERNPRYSIRAWAAQLELKGHSYLYQVFKGDRRLKLDLAQKIIAPVKLSKVEKKYFELLVMEENAETNGEKDTYRQLRTAILPFHANKDKKVVILKQEYFKVISDWYHFAILEMINLKNFDSNPVTISKMLRGKVDPQMVKEAIDRMIKLDLIIDVNGKLKRVEKSTVVAEYEAPVEAIRSHHTQMIDLAKNAINGLAMEKRDIRGSTFTIRLEDKEEMQALIRSFHQQMLKYAITDSQGDVTVQFNTQLLQLTDVIL